MSLAFLPCLGDLHPSPTMSRSISNTVITCRAAVCWGLGEPLKVEDIQVEPPRSSEIRIKMLCSSLCHTDILYWKDEAHAFFPRVLGHEGVGVVESVGEGVAEVKEGDLVIPTYIGECRECQNCTSMKTNLCLKYHLTITGLMPDNTSRMSARGQKLYHTFSCATWSEYTVVNINYVVKINAKIPLQHASLLSCGFSTGFGAAWKEAKIEKGSSVAVFGLGAVGLGVVEGARQMEASKIIGVDLNEWKKEKGEVFGMTDFINPAKHNKLASDVIKEITGGLGVDYAFECTGVTPLINQALECTTVGKGVTIVIGTGAPSGSINIFALMLGRTLKGTVFGGIKPQSDLPFIIENKEIKIDALVTREISVDDVNQALQLMETQSDCLKVLIKMNKEI